MLCGFLSIAGVITAFILLPRQPRLSDSVLGHEAVFIQDLLSDTQAAGLRNIAKDQVKIFHNIAKDVNFYTSKHEHIGEAEPLTSDGKCARSLLVPNRNGTACVLPGRVDVARHFVRTGGLQGLKESFDVTVSRLQSFADYIFDVDKYPIIRELFESEKFLASAKSVCPPDRQYLDPFQMNFILQVPGQTVAVHTDAPYFFGATRFQFPQWLLVAMVHSGLYAERFVHQVQVVGYFHEWQATKLRAGSFVFWDEEAGTPRWVLPHSQAGTIVDGSKVVHAATVYNGPGGKIPKPPKIDKQKECTLEHKGEEVWHVICDGELMQDYTTHDLRFAIVYRGKCFRDAAEAKRFNEMKEEEMLTLDEILLAFKRKLVERGRISSVESAPKAPFDLAILIIDEFIRYPHSPRTPLPINYCAIGKLYPWLGTLMDWTLCRNKFRFDDE